ncbi:unnamed protein product [Protopolystoma xenopodis]|uniref:Uncharacterized protein n=1 Tax=Protopolystoma xenopodis TaxID=117903 RepID=A0A3S5BPD1_9PLAT|nr:unnamed protein product [Protopolystoma xenopodis]
MKKPRSWSIQAEFWRGRTPSCLDVVMVTRLTPFLSLMASFLCLIGGIAVGQHFGVVDFGGVLANTGCPSFWYRPGSKGGIVGFKKPPQL